MRMPTWFDDYFEQLAVISANGGSLDGYIAKFGAAGRERYSRDINRLHKLMGPPPRHGSVCGSSDEAFA